MELSEGMGLSREKREKMVWKRQGRQQSRVYMAPKEPLCTTAAREAGSQGANRF